MLYSATVSSEAIGSGTPVEFILTVKNTGDAPAVFMFPNTQRYNIVVWDEDCVEAWRWSAGKAFAQMVQTITVPAGGTATFHIQWDQRDEAGRPVRPGAYEARVAFLGRWGKRTSALVLRPLIFGIR